MKRRLLAVLVLSVAVSGVAVASASAGVPKAGVSSHGVTHVGASGFALLLLYDQNDSPSGALISSQNFGDVPQYSSAAADDFTVPAGQKWQIEGLNVTGAYVGPGPAQSETVTFYANDHNRPGVVKSTQTVVGTDTSGSFAIPLAPVKLNGAMKGKRFWVSVAVNMDFGVGGQWAWNLRSTQRGAPAMWQNPAGGFALGCTTWDPLTACTGFTGPDLLFSLNGFVILPS